MNTARNAPTKATISFVEAVNGFFGAGARLARGGLIEANEFNGDGTLAQRNEKAGKRTKKRHPTLNGLSPQTRLLNTLKPLELLGNPWKVFGKSLESLVEDL